MDSVPTECRRIHSCMKVDELDPESLRCTDTEANNLHGYENI